MAKNIFPSTKTEFLNVPWDSTLAPTGGYAPVDCDFTDELEFVAVKKIAVEVKYWKNDQDIFESIGLISDIETSNNEEHLIMAGGDRIRLDRIIRLRMV